MARYRLTDNPNLVYDTWSLVTLDITDGSSYSQTYLDWLADGNTPDPAPVLTFDDYVALFEPKFEQWLEDTAASNGYKSSLSCISYKGSVVPEFDADAQAMFAWRDALWVWLYTWKSGLNGQLPSPVPTVDAIKAMAPQPETYGWVVHNTGITASAQIPPENPTS